jgi:WD40 repeat protein
VARLWQVEHTPLEIGRPLPFPKSDTSRRSLWSPDRRLFTPSDDGSVFAWKPGDPPNPQPLFQQPGLTAIALSNDGRQIHGASNGYLHTWDSSSGKRVGNEEAVLRFVRALAPDHSLALVTESMDSAARVWNRTTRLLGPPLNDGGEIRGAIFSPDGKLVLLLDYNQQGRLYDTRSGNQVGGLLRFRHWIRTLAFSPDSNTVLAFNGDVAYRYQVGSENKLLAVRLTPAPVDAVRFPTDCNDCFEAFMSPAPGRYQIHRVTWTLDDVPPMIGDLSALRHDWQIRLALRAKTSGDFEPLR